LKHTVDELTLKNGAKGLLVHVPDASVLTLEINFRAGEYLVENDKWEAPHLMEHVLLGANKHHPKARIFQAEFEKNGAYNNASTSAYSITYEAECADFEWQRILDLTLAAITEPLFLQEEFEAEFGNVREELSSRSNNHFRHLSLALRQIYGYAAKTDQERLELMANVTLADIQAHYKRTHTTSNMRFVIGGNMTPSRKKQIQQILENVSLPKGKSRFALPKERPIHLEKPLYIHNDSVKNVYFYLDTFMNRRMSEAEVDALSLANTLLVDTLYSKILGTAREQGLVYGMSSGFGQALLNSNWWVGAQVMPKNAPKLFEIMTRELQAVYQGDLAHADIVAAQQYSLGRFQRSAQTVSGVAGGYSGMYFFDDIIEDYYQVPQRIKRITKESIVDIMRALFADDIWGVGVLGSCGETFADEMQQQVSVLWPAGIRKK
jgi:predicted Zn-dependent peptidase